MTRVEFNNVVLNLSRKLFIIAFRFLRNKEEAEDAVQEVFIKLWKMKEKLDEYNSVEGLAKTIIKNYCIDQIRRNKTIRIEKDFMNYQLNSEDPSPVEELQMNETSQILHSIIEKLPVVYRDIIKQREIDGISYKEIAVKTNQNINTLRVTLSRARKLIKDEYKKYLYEYKGTEQVARKIL
jgi:RNA polymerase sigma-70 factor, ECF subfamily